MASIEATQRRRDNRRSARQAKEAKQRGRATTPALVLPPAVARKSGGRRAAERSMWEARVAERMALRLDPEGLVTGFFRLNYRYWQCRFAGFDPEAKVIGYRLDGRLVLADAFRVWGKGVIHVEHAVVYDWWVTLDWDDRQSLRQQARDRRDAKTPGPQEVSI